MPLVTNLLVEPECCSQPARCNVHGEGQREAMSDDDSEYEPEQSSQEEEEADSGSDFEEEELRGSGKRKASGARRAAVAGEQVITPTHSEAAPPSQAL